MRLKYYLRGLGLGIIFAVIIMMIGFHGNKQSMSDTEIIEKPGNTVYHPNAAFLPGGAFNPYFRSFLSLFFASQTRRRNPVQHCHHND